MKYTKHILLLFMILIVFCGCDISFKDNWVPQDGIWRCEDLQLELSFEKGVDTYIEIEGQRIRCVCLNDKGSQYISVLIQETGVHSYVIGSTVFYGKYICLTDTCYTVMECETERIYEFIKIP